MRILFVGGGSGGPVAPLLAVAEQIRKNQPSAKFLLLGTKSGPEKLMAENANIGFQTIPSGKWRRYFNIKNLFTPFLIIAGLFSSFKILKKFRPDCVFAAGSFIQVPVIWAAWLLRIPCVIHQQDITPSLANKLCEPFVKKITVCFEKSLTDFASGFGLFYQKKPWQKVVQTGNPFRRGLMNSDKNRALKHLGLNKKLPVLLVLGGGTGSEFINRLIIESLPELSKIVQIIHSLGSRKQKQIQFINYYPSEFISNMADAYSAADFILSRAGLSTITELSALKKVSIIIPMPNTHQEYNAELLASLNAALVLNQKHLTSKIFPLILRKLIFDFNAQQIFTKNISEIMPKNSDEKIADIILKIIEK